MPGRTHHRHRQNGFTLLELTAVLCVVGLVTAGIWVAASSAYRAHKISSTIDQMREIVENIRTRYNASASLPVQDYMVFTQTMARADVFPAETKLSPATAPAACANCYFMHPWSNNGAGSICGGGTICVAATPNNLFGGAAAGFAFAIMLRSLPQDACISIASKFTDIWDDVGLVAIGMDTADAVIPGTIYAAPQTVTTLSGACSAAAPTNLYFAFRLAP